MSDAEREKQEKAEKLKNRSEEMEKIESAANSGRTGVGTRLCAGMTRGKGTTLVKWEAFDDSQPATLPKTIAEFLKVLSLSPDKDEPQIVEYLIEGYNVVSYTAASDPLAEFVDSAWPSDAQTQFRLVVRNYSRGAGVSLEDAVALIKPGFGKQYEPKPSA